MVFFMFVDSDDCIHIDYINTLYDCIMEDGTALAICSAIKFYSKTAPTITGVKDDGTISSILINNMIGI